MNKVLLVLGRRTCAHREDWNCSKNAMFCPWLTNVKKTDIQTW